MPQALIVAHGQPSNPAPPEAAMAHLAGQVQKRLPDWRIRAATLAAPGRLEETLAELPKGILVYPFFMTDGWFVRTALPERLAIVGPARAMSPFGLDAQLPELAAGMIRRGMLRDGLTVDCPQILLSAHGAVRGQNAARATHAFGDRLEQLLPGAVVKTGFVEQAPFISEVAEQVRGPAISLPFFALNGDHYAQDILPALNQSGFTGLRLPVLGAHSYVPGLIAGALENEMTHKAMA